MPRGSLAPALDNPSAAEVEAARFATAVTNVPPMRYVFNNTCLDILAVAAEMMQGEIAYRRGQFDAAFAHLRRSVELTRPAVRRTLGLDAANPSYRDVNDLRVFAARSRRGSSVGRTRGCWGPVRRYGNFAQARSVSKLMMAAQQVPPKWHDRGVTAGKRCFRDC